MADLSIIAVSFQSSARLPAFVEASRLAAPDAELVIVDNASTDGSADLAAHADPTVKLVRLDRNQGFGRSSNVGSEVAGGHWLLFANPDVRLLSVPRLPGDYKGQFGVGAAAALSHANKTPAHPTLRAETSLAEDWLREVVGRFLPPSVNAQRRIREQPPRWATGALLLVRREEFLRIGGFDPRFFLYYEDRDLGARYQRAAHKVRAINGLGGVHAPHSSSVGAADWQRSAWALASWIEYVGIWHGQDVADRLGRSAMVWLKTIVRLGIAGRGWPRVVQKRRQVREIIDFLSELDRQLPNGDLSYYPHAQLAFAAARRCGWW